VGGAGEEVAGGDAGPGLGERGVVLVHEGRGDEVVVLVELVEVEWFADAAERDGPGKQSGRRRAVVEPAASVGPIVDSTRSG
jgi:hypothetical protein